MKTKEIQIKCEANKYYKLDELNFFQGKLKSITEDNFKKLKQSIVKNGLPLAFHVWIDSKGKVWIVDGHHRFLALKALVDDGYNVDTIPCNLVMASNRKEAAQVVLISNSKYAEMSDESLSDFMIDFELKIDDLDFLDIKELKNFAPIFDDANFNPSESVEADKKHKVCPHCNEPL